MPGALRCIGTGLVPAGEAEESTAEFKGHSISQLHLSHTWVTRHHPVPSPLNSVITLRSIPITLGQHFPSATAETIYFQFLMKKSATLLTPVNQISDFHLQPVALLPS